MQLAIIGCGHGHLDLIYSTVSADDQRTGTQTDLVIICGDFQAIRNEADLDNLCTPPKYRHMGDFHKYYSGASKAAYLTIVIGGNHESSAFMWELYHGGWLAENIYFMGWANVVKVGGVTIGGVSGIWGNLKDYPRGHHEVAPYRPSDLRSVYYYRRHETEQLSLYPNPIDMFLSHDWPRNITHHGDKAKLFKIRPDFQKSISEDHFGARSLEHLLHHLRPAHWFAGHMHVEFAATVAHDSPPQTNPDVVAFTHVPPPPVTMSKRAAQRAAKEAVAAGLAPPPKPAPAPTAAVPAKTTAFLALDKCVDTHNPAVHFTTLPHLAPGPLTYDLDWLAILRATHPSMSTSHERNLDPTNWDALRSRVATAKSELLERFPLGQADTGLVIPSNFKHTAPVHGPHVAGAVYAMAKRPQWNPQTEVFATWVLGLPESSVNADGVQAEEYAAMVQTTRAVSSRK